MLTRAVTPAMIPGVMHKLLPIGEDALGPSFRFRDFTIKSGCSCNIGLTFKSGCSCNIGLQCTLGAGVQFTLLTRPNVTTMKLFVASVLRHETSNMRM